MTTALWDIPRSNVVVFMGSNASENHPISMKWFLRAKENGATVIAIDPRYNRTGSKADIYVPMRSGTDIAILGGLIRYAIDKGRIHRDYVVNYTNAPLLLNPNFKFDEGVFSGWDETAKRYNRNTWTFQTGEDGLPLRDDTLRHPDSVFQHLKRLYNRYTPEVVAEMSGMSVDDFLKIADIITSTYEPGKSAVFAYAMGWTQHTKGVQNIRTASLLQLLLGNIGVPGGGIAALRGHANVQGATDMAAMYHDLPGYLGIPRTSHKTLDEFIDKTTPKTGYWINKKKFMVSLLKAWWGDRATAENDFAYDYMPKLKSQAYSHYDIFQAALEGVVKGLFVFGQNPAVGSANVTKIHQALAKLDWMVVSDMFMHDTAEFWQLPGMKPEDVKTEVFFLPAAGPVEKEGSFTNTHRLIQWKHKAIEPLGDSKSDLWYANALALRLKELYQDSNLRRDEPIKYLHWDYEAGIDEEPSAEAVAREINGYEWATKKQLAGFGAYRDDGSTAGGNWIYSGMYTEEGNIADRREKDPNDYMYHGWGFAWPANRRVLYNRASADPQGRPWSEEKKLVWWDAAAGKWVGLDVPDMLPTLAPDAYNTTYNFGGNNPFIMKDWGRAGLFGPLADGPFPEHYEPVESPTQNRVSKRQFIPTAVIYQSEYDRIGTPEEFPYVMTTYRLTEHLTSGIMTRFLPWLAEAFPQPFVEISEELAKEKGIKNLDWIRVKSARGEIEVQALVTRRLRPLKVNGRIVHEIGVPIHWSNRGIVTADITNRLTPQFADVNVNIQESKAFLANIEKIS